MQDIAKAQWPRMQVPTKELHCKGTITRMLMSRGHGLCAHGHHRQLPCMARPLLAHQRRCWVAAAAGGFPPGQIAHSTTESGQQLIKVTIRKPLGLVLGEAERGGAVIVEEIVQGGNAEQTGAVHVGDIVSRVSATVLKEGKSGQYEREGYGSQPYSNFEQIMFDCQNQDFKRWGIMNVRMEFVREKATSEPATYSSSDS